MKAFLAHVIHLDACMTIFWKVLSQERIDAALIAIASRVSVQAHFADKPMAVMHGAAEPNMEPSAEHSEGRHTRQHAAITPAPVSDSMVLLTDEDLETKYAEDQIDQTTELTVSSVFPGLCLLLPAIAYFTLLAAGRRWSVEEDFEVW